MVLEIKLSNFYSIKEEVTLDFRAASIQTQKAQKIKHNTFAFNRVKLLKTIAIYGANASGKSNIIKAIRFCHSMVIESHLHNENTVYNFQPFKFDGWAKRPSTYFIRFVVKGIEYEYSFTLSQTEIIKESLYHYPKGRIAKVFTRDEFRGAEKQEIYSFGSAIQRPMDVAINTSKKTLFVSRASQMDRALPKIIFKYFVDTFILDYNGLDIRSVAMLFDTYKKTLLEALKVADSDITDIRLQKEKQRQSSNTFTANFAASTATIANAETEGIKITAYHKKSPNVPFNFLIEESAGTIKLFFMMLTILDVIKKNNVLLVDEIEGSLHAAIVDYVIDLFHAGNSAQLLFTTHNTNLLNLNKLRKDQIYFANKRSDASTELYSLFDFSDFRDTMDLKKAYLQGRFDAIPYVNDSHVKLKSIIHEQE